MYWYTVEFGAHREDGELRAYGAGIAGCIEECDVIFLF
jgi:phenylalanine-4-hydroxylase